MPINNFLRFWYYIIRDPIFWTSLEFSGDKVPSTVIIDLLKRYPSLERLHLISVPNVIDILQELSRYDVTLF